MRNQTKKDGGGGGGKKNCPGVDEPPEMQSKLAIRSNVISPNARFGLTMMFGTGEFTLESFAIKFLIETPLRFYEKFLNLSAGEQLIFSFSHSRANVFLIIRL